VLFFYHIPFMIYRAVSDLEVITTSLQFYNVLHWSHALFVKVAPGIALTSWSQHHFFAIGKPELQKHKASQCGNKQQ